MNKIKLLFLALITAFCYQTTLGQSYTVSACSDLGSNTYGPMNSNSTANSKNRTAFILPAAQVAGIADGTVTSVYFKRLGTATMLPGSTFKIYLKSTTQTDFGTSSIDWTTETAGATLVYDADPAAEVGNSAGYKQFLLSTPFPFAAGNNLAVYLEYVQTTAQTTSITWNYEYTNPCISTTNNNTTKYQNTTAALTSTIATSNYRRPLIAFDATFPPANAAPTCTTVTAPAAAATGVSVTPTITWNQIGGQNGATSYLINVGTTAGGTDVINGLEVTGNSYAIPATSPLLYSTQYFVTIIPKNSIGVATGCSDSSFTTGTIPCPTITAPAANATNVSLTPTFTWNAIPGAIDYAITIGTTSGGNDILDFFSVGNVTTYTLPTALNYGTIYYYSINSIATTSATTTCAIRNFTTVCAPLLPTYSYDFATVPGLCWARASGGSPATGVGTGTTNYWVADGFLNSGTTGAAKINLYSTNRIGWLLSPTFDLSAGGYRMKFDYGVTTYAGTGQTTMGSDDIIQVVISTDGGVTWTAIQTWTAANTPNNTSNQFLFDLSAFTGPNTVIAFFGSDGTVDDSPDYEFFLDNFVVEPIPTCDGPNNITVTSFTSTSATLAWVAPTVAPSNGYEIYYDSMNTPPTAASVANGGTSTTTGGTVSGLSANTTYEIWVRSICGSTKSAWIGPITVYTGYCTPAPTSTDGQGITNVTFGSAPNVVNNTTVDEPGHYGDYTTMIGDISAGVATDVSITYSTGFTYGTKIWVDLNNDLTFDNTTELLYTGLSSSTNPTTLVANITIPGTTPLGNYRMRIGGTDDNLGPATACYNSTYGTFEDYTVNVTAAPSCLPPTALTTVLTPTSATVSWTASASAPNMYDVYVSTTNVQPATPTYAGVIGTSQVVTGAPLDMFYVWVVSNCGSSMSTPAAISFQLPPTNDNCSGATSMNVGTDFASGAITGSLQGATDGAVATCVTNSFANVWYSVVVPPSGQLTITTDTATGSSLIDTVIEVFSGACGALTSIACDDDAGNGNFSLVNINDVALAGQTVYVSVWKYGPGALNVPTFQLSAYSASLGTTDIVKNDQEFSFYPNPFDQVAYIKDVKNVKSVQIIDIAGRVVKTISSPSNELKVGDLEKGLYVFVFEMNNGTKHTVKAIKK